MINNVKCLDLWKKEILPLRGLQCSDSSRVSDPPCPPFYMLMMFVSVDLHMFYQCVCEHGGYDGCVSKKAWKSVYDELGGNPQNTSAATCTRRHYEK